MRKIILILIFLGLSGCASVPPYTRPIAPPVTQFVPGVHHRVEAGQTLWRISKIYDVDIDEILRVNHISGDAAIEIGQMLLIPNRLKQQNVPVKSSMDDFIWPLKGRVIAGFGVCYHNIINKGINLQGVTGTDVLAARQGRVVFYAGDFGNFGKTVIIDHGDGLRSIYSRVSEVFVRPGEDVRRGAVIARIGSAKRDKAVYLHFEIRKGALAQNPLFYLP
ncbi:MAG: LysM peptidoglycan-binding domain-containing M23 family metallopeptidase [Candidatus Omnitrophota bacterium]|nr:LysM peptidoglycan-binding domain-containing M23 family metallopeptidase [Candidatus Omnitrophota bacterium]